ncbi:MAG: pyrroline-5-carboxylate reductase dimerization domain-containing protein [Erythrobacter sp.]|nr:pyrroline-5-carboxylate reductase dimerization domain-containing protein [Erythrobacter sp.]
MANIRKLVIAGLGNMAGAMLDGWMAAGQDPARFSALGPRPKKTPDGVAFYCDPAEVQGHDALLLGFKPHHLPEVSPTLQAIASAEVTVYSLLAGITLDQLRSAFPKAKAHVRVMPNLASRIGKSPIILAELGLDHDERKAANALFDDLGQSVWLDSEEHYDLCTALAGSGPGFVYRFIDALATAAHELGLDAESARSLSLAMVEGGAALAAASDLSPGELAERVASPGGMTREGLNVLDDNRALHNLLVETLRATRDRGAALSAGSN